MNININDFDEQYVRKMGDVRYEVTRNCYNDHYQWTVYVGTSVVDDHTQHANHTYKKDNGVRVSGFPTLVLALKHMGDFAKEPSEYVEDYCEMLKHSNALAF